LNKDTKSNIRAAVKVGFRYLVPRATFICTTLSIGTNRKFDLALPSHFVTLDEAGQADSVDTVELYSHYWDVKIIA
ncbi:hypothetical protein BCR34DRAFT_489160, partial [Clohesyomyces aquaticus]